MNILKYYDYDVYDIPKTDIFVYIPGITIRLMRDEEQEIIRGSLQNLKFKMKNVRNIIYFFKNFYFLGKYINFAHEINWKYISKLFKCINS